VTSHTSALWKDDTVCCSGDWALAGARGRGADVTWRPPLSGSSRRTTQSKQAARHVGTAGCTFSFDKQVGRTPGKPAKRYTGLTRFHNPMEDQIILELLAVTLERRAPGTAHPQQQQSGGGTGSSEVTA